MPTPRGNFDTSQNDTSNIVRTNHLLVVGIDKYAHCPPLYNCVKDAQYFITVLKKRFLFEEANITTIFNEKATRRNINRALRQLAVQLGPKDNLLIYFSGHGEFDNIYRQGYWIPVEAKLGEHDDYIPNGQIRTALSAIKSHHPFLISDSCFSGSLFADATSRQISKR